MRPGLRRAGSRISIRLVAMMILIVCVDSKPSSWLSSSSIVRCTSESPLCPSMRDPPIESTSSMKMMQGECCLAITNSSRTILAPSPMYFCTNYDPDTLMKVQSVWWAIALANSVLPVPGGPYISTPFGCAIPRDSKISGCLIGNSMTSFTSLTCWSRPPIMSQVESGTFSTFMRETRGSTLVGSTLWRIQLSERTATLRLGLMSSILILLSTVTTYLPSWLSLTKTRFFPITFTTSPTQEQFSCKACSSSLSLDTLQMQAYHSSLVRSAVLPAA